MQGKNKDSCIPVPSIPYTFAFNSFTSVFCAFPWPEFQLCEVQAFSIAWPQGSYLGLILVGLIVLYEFHINRRVHYNVMFSWKVEGTPLVVMYFLCCTIQRWATALLIVQHEHWNVKIIWCSYVSIKVLLGNIKTGIKFFSGHRFNDMILFNMFVLYIVLNLW